MNRYSTNPRFEFRAFGEHFGRALDMLHTSFEVVAQDEALHTYLLSATNHQYNIKIAGDKLEVKVLLREQQGVECWSPYLQLPFPLTAAFLHEFLFAWLEIDPPLLRRSHYDTHQFIQELITPNPHLRTAQVCKKRRLYTVNNCRVEVADLWIADRHPMRTIAIDASKAEDVLQTVEQLGLHSFVNMNYIAELNQILDKDAPIQWFPPIRAESFMPSMARQLVFMR